MSKIGDAFGKLGESGPSMSPEMEPAEPMDPMSEEGDELSEVNAKAELAAAKAVMKAVSGGKPEALRDALKSFIEACGGY